MAKNNKEKETKAPETTPEPTGAEGGANNQNTDLSDRIEELSARLARIHAFAVGEVTGPKRGVVEDVEDVINGLRARVAELEGASAVESRDVGAASSSADDKGRAAEAYDLFRERQVEGNFPAWAELPEETQKLWRDSYHHVAGGGEPRTDYEEAVKYLINSAQ